MAPVFATPSPTSRRTRRREHRQRQRCHRQQQSTEQLWKQSSNEQPASQPRDWLEMDSQDKESASAAWTRPHAAKFIPSIDESIHSNPFSILDFGIPSPTLSFPRFFLPDDSEQHASTSPDIYGIGTSTGFSIPAPESRVSKKLRRDSWASNLQKEGLIRNQHDALIQDAVSPPVASHIKPPQTQDVSAHSSCSEECSKPTPVSIFRVPSPLLYHRRSHAAAAGSSGSEQYDESLGFTHTRLMSEIRTRTQQRKRKVSIQSQKPTFVAAKLPLMGSAAASEDSSDQEALSVNTSAVGEHDIKSLSPIVTTTNVYLCPQNLYQIFDCAPESGFNKSGLGSSNPLWLADQSLVFPKMTLSGQMPACGGSVNMLERSTTTVQHPQVVGLDALAAHFLDSRDRSSTQDSLDRNFTVAGAVLSAAKERNGTNILLCSNTDLAPDSKTTVPSEPVSQIRCSASPNSAGTSLHSEHSLAESQSTVIVTSKQTDTITSTDGDLFPDLDKDNLDTVNVSREDAISSDDEWMWADDQWQSDVTTPQSVEASQIGLCATEWA